MKMTLKKLQKLLLAAALLCCVIVLASCGATVDTEFTADNNFAGTRVITVTLDNSDLNDYVNGGAESIEATVKKYIPDCMTYTATKGDSSLVYKFTLSFTDIDDYREKIAKVLAAEKDDPITAEIEYENVGSPFKSSLKFNENITSMDLIGWLRYGLETDKVVSEGDTSNWFESGDTSVTIGGTEYRAYSNISVDDSVYNTPDSIQVKTYFLTSGNFDRTIDFYFSNDTLTSLSEQSVNVEEVLKSTSETVTVEKKTEEYQTIYSVKMSGLTAEQTAAETAKVMQSENVSFSASVAPDVNVARRMLINVSEKIDGTYYLRNDRNLNSIYFLYNGAELSNSSTISFGYFYEDDLRGYSYIPAYVDGETAESSFIWDVDFESAGAELDFAGGKVNFDVKMYAAQDMLPDAKQMLNDALTEAVPEGAKLNTAEEDGLTVYTIDLGTKSPEDEAALYREFVYNYTGEKPVCEFGVEKGTSSSPFKTVTSYSAVVDMSDLSDKSIDFTFKSGGSLYVLDNSQITPPEEETDTADYTGTFYGSLRFYAIEESANVFAYIFLIGLIVCAAAFIIVVAVSIKGWMKAAKEKPAKPIAIEGPAVPVIVTQNEADESDDEEEFV